MTHLSAVTVSPASGPTSSATLLSWGQEAAEQAAFERALELLTRAEAQARQEGAGAVQARACTALGKVYRNLGEPGRALNCLDLALELASQGGDAALQGYRDMLVGRAQPRDGFTLSL